MDRYRNYKAEDFLNDPFFKQWLIEADGETNKLWQKYLLDNPEKRKEVQAARILLKALGHAREEPDSGQGVSMWKNIQAQTKPELEEKRGVIKLKTTPIWRFSAAASILLVVGLLGWMLVIRGMDKPANSYAEQVAEVDIPLIEEVNPTTKPKRLLLPDQSQVLLYPSGKLSYRAHFSGDNRTVYLSGKAHFDVVKDSLRPFIVFANALVTQVVGTSFTINSPSATELATVRVESGKVKVFTLRNFIKKERNSDTETALLTPNQQVTYDPVKATLTKGVIAQPELLNKPQAYPDFYFENTNVTSVFKTLEESYGVTIRYDAKTIQECSVTAPLGNEPLFRKLDIICQTIGATYEVWGTEIVVSGPGCGL